MFKISIELNYLTVFALIMYDYNNFDYSLLTFFSTKTGKTWSLFSLIDCYISYEINILWVFRFYIKTGKELPF